MNNKERKKGFWFKKFFECLEILTIHMIGDPMRQWHCPACKGGPCKFRKLAQLLEKELRLMSSV
ncbi:hypothetical protein H5410_046635 [Solanum commersonii]|uniref:Uncharacterized protein n=1 Tax=Solanum commersonii TaxID=4109 RepID=A0A9J5XCT8_SOLCO|nr:hypothetical protein H5410_046635 [Solanum commersonii]